MIDYASTFIGQPYYKGGCFNDEKGGDCTGLVENVLDNILPEYHTATRHDTNSLRNSGYLRKNQYNFKKGDILLFAPTPSEKEKGVKGHAGFVADIGEDGKTISMIHSAGMGWNPGAPNGVQITEDIWGEKTPNAYNNYWINQYEGYIPFENLLIKKK